LIIIKNKTVFKCSGCGYEASKWVGRCPECGSWNTLEEKIIENQKNTRAAAAE
jgi:DNA repair protein RadA/Sms